MLKESVSQVGTDSVQIIAYYKMWRENFPQKMATYQREIVEYKLYKDLTTYQ